MTVGKSTEPKWLTVDMVLGFHNEQLVMFGGGEGIRDPGLLESGMARAPNRHHYEPSATLFELAAAYGVGIVKNHPFVDGNKRTGLISMHVFLVMNGWNFDADQVDEFQTILRLAAGDLKEDELARWLEKNSRKA
ncbi:MAG: type II toxin-antitoxin system death-on-curing family toxin [Rhodospirillales bacterium]|nr:type II toxin-antitoxin system death-on-curing family toxin [Rhodospirillales bacterium]